MAIQIYFYAFLVMDRNGTILYRYQHTPMVIHISDHLDIETNGLANHSLRLLKTKIVVMN